MDGLVVRFASACDEVRCAACDEYLHPSLLTYKITTQQIVLAERAGELIGYLRLEYLWGKVPYIGLIRVVPAYRGIGIGRSILHFLEASLRGQGYQVLFSSSQVNEAAPQAWHRAMGFEECGIIAGINDGGIGEVFFRKRLR